jgi:hypothetical protein
MINVEAMMSSSLRGEVYGDHELLHSGATGRAAFSLIASHPPTCTMSSNRWSTTLGRGRMVTNRDRSDSHWIGADKRQRGVKNSCGCLGEDGTAVLLL